MLRCPNCGHHVRKVSDTIADYYCSRCNEVFDIEDLDTEDMSDEEIEANA